MSAKKEDPKRIVIFDDSRQALERFKDKMKKSNVEILSFRNSQWDETLSKKIQEFKPQLFVVDLLLGESKEDGYKLIKDIGKARLFQNIPIVVCSKLINETEKGKREKEECLGAPGVVAAFSKFPDFPPAEEILKYIP